MIFVLVISLLLFSRTGDAEFAYKEHLKRTFEAQFHKKCDKYAFVKRWVDRLEYTDDRYLTFVYQEPGFRNGGLGDRMGGLISAVAIATRFNRTMLIRSKNEIGKLFRPYHPTDIKNPIPKYNWGNWTSWSNYNSKYELNDDTEYDIYDCINNVGSRNRHCSVNDVYDVPQQHILYRSNRAYLCYYDNNPVYIGGEQMLAMGVNKSSDLFEVAGCMLRLALWPTDYLWDEVASIYQKFEDSVFRDQQAPKRQRRGLRRNLEETLPSSAATATGTGSTEHVNAAPFYQVGLHFRCGDKSFMGRAGDQCTYDPVNRPNEPGLIPGNPVGIGQCARDTLRNYSASIVHHHTAVDGDEVKASPDSRQQQVKGEQQQQHEKKSERPERPVLTVEQERERQGNKRNSETGRRATSSLNATTATAAHLRRSLISDNNNPSSSSSSSGAGMKRFELAFITSDSTASADQMKQVLGHPYTLISPQGCHIEMDASVACHVFTVSYWFVLALSDVLVTQTLGQDHSAGPTSSFSRYAGIYGLKDDVFRDGRHCDEITSNFALSRIQQSNWFC